MNKKYEFVKYFTYLNKQLFMQCVKYIASTIYCSLHIHWPPHIRPLCHVVNILLHDNFHLSRATPLIRPLNL